MRSGWAIARREYASFFRTPLGWVLIALFLFLSGIFFTYRVLDPGQPASMRGFFEAWWSLLAIIVPAVSMRLLSEELRTGTIEPLLTSPATELAIIAGKFAGAAAFLLTAIAPTLIYVAILHALARPDPGPILAGFLGVTLLGVLYLAVGTLLSSLTSSQTLAFLATLFVLLAIEVGASQLAVRLPEPWDRAAAACSPSLRLADFAKGVIDTGHVAFFILVSAWFLVLASVLLRLRRWR
ncbi:MAG: ABC transporter permease subunit [Phycisphaerae bacterium]|nr:ABC transporter permease subunit [Phycisphaerae bacterium]